jgi:hypothetical protein
MRIMRKACQTSIASCSWRGTCRGGSIKWPTRVQGDLQVGSTSLIAALAEEDYVANIATESSPATATTKPGSTSQPRNSGRCCCG